MKKKKSLTGVSVIDDIAGSKKEEDRTPPSDYSGAEPSIKISVGDQRLATAFRLSSLILSFLSSFLFEK